MQLSIETNKILKRITLKNTTYFSEDHSFEQADIVICGNKIQKIIPPNSSENNNCIDGQNMIIFPGLINAHLHPSKELYGGIKAFSSISEILDTVHRNNHLETSSLQSLASYYSILNSMRQGITTMGIFTSRAEIDAEQVKKTGIRGIIHFSQNDQWIGKEIKPTSCSPKQVIERYFNCVNEYESDLIKIHPATASELSATPELMQELHRLAFQDNKKFAMHICEGSSQVKQCVEHYGESGIKLLDKLHVLDSSILLVHASSLLEEDVRLLSEKQLNFIHCPVSNSFTGAGRMPFKALLKSCIAMGTDAAMVNPFNKLSFDAAFSLYFHGETCLDEKIPPSVIVDSLTKNGALALGIKNVGCIKEGMLADLCCFDKNSIAIESQEPNLLFLDTILKKAPIHVMVDGQFVIYSEQFINCAFDEIESDFIKNKKIAR